MYSKYIPTHKYPHDFNENGLEPTKNRMGGMHSLSKYSAQFINFSEDANLQVMDIGCAYGVATIPALERGAKVIAVDIEKEHLDILLLRTPTHLANQLTIVKAKFPDELDLKHESLSAILMSRVFSFLTPVQIKCGLKKIYNWLEVGGKVFAINHTPYIKLFEHYIQEYEMKKEMQDPWPGLILDLKSHPKYEPYRMPSWINLMDKHIFEAIFTEAGFHVQELEYFSAAEIVPKNDVQFDGRELVGCVAVKGPIREK